MKNTKIQSIQVGEATVHIGDIFSTCWGYEQTNVEFYEVVSLHGTKTVGLREIARQVVEETSWCSTDVRPVPGKFIDEEVHKRRVSVRGSGSYSVAVRFSDATHAYRTPPEKSHHCSWGY